MALKGSIPGKLSFAANSGKLERTRANSARTRQRFANTDTLPNSGERSPEYAERSAEFGGVRPSSPVLLREQANGSPENSFAGGNPSAANYVRRWRTAVRHKAYFGWGERLLLANRWRIRAEFARVCPSSREFAANESSPSILPTKDIELLR